jgi:hypothetical protein
MYLLSILSYAIPVPMPSYPTQPDPSDPQQSNALHSHSLTRSKGQMKTDRTPNVPSHWNAGQHQQQQLQYQQQEQQR